MSTNHNSGLILSNDSVCLTLRAKCRRIFHWAPLTALSIIFYITACGTIAMSHILHPLHSIGGLLNFLVYLTEFYSIMCNYTTACFIGPGFIELGYTPANKEDVQYLQFCELCESYKAPRAHHCRKCDRCVMKMDHHCPWINTCCGHLNHGFFVYFLFFAPIGCIHSTILLSCTLYYAIYLEYFIMTDGAIVVLSMTEFLCIFFATGLSIGVVIAVGSLFVMQMKSIMKNETGVESWIKEKAQLRLSDNNNNSDNSDSNIFIYPYDLGSSMANIKSVLTWSGRCRGNGVLWPVRDGCGQYDLTKEQMLQKKDKALHSQLYEIKTQYNGALLPLWSVGCRATLGSPCTDEYRLPVSPGQLLKVTRWRKHWLYGQIVYPQNANLLLPEGRRVKKGKPRGWFPVVCARLYRGGFGGGEGDSRHCAVAAVTNNGFSRDKTD